MNKTTFKKLTKERIKNFSIEKQIDTLSELEKDTSVWIKEMRAQILKNKWFCKNCRKYSDAKKVKQITRTEISEGECIYTDAGYGDDDEFADVEYLVTYEICPVCKKEIYKSRLYIRKFNKRDRYGNKY